MDITSEEIRSSRFQGTRHVYDRREVDAFLHRAASTLEIYERKLTVTESHVQNLEKALELAQSRARSMSSLDARIAELESALAASQHNYESAMSELEARAESESDNHSLASAERELQVRVEAAEALKAEASRSAEAVELDARTAADSILSAAHLEAEEILRTALLAQTSILEEVEQMRLSAQQKVSAELEELRTAQAAAGVSDTAASDEGLRTAEAKLSELAEVSRRNAAKGKSQLKKANKRAAAAEARANEAQQHLVQARQELEAKSLELSNVVAATEGGGEQDLSEVEDLRRQVAQLRTALANIQERFSSASQLSPQELELAAALVDLDLPDVDLLVDLTTASMTEVEVASDHGTATSEAEDDRTELPEEPRVAIKSKWAQAEPVPAGALSEGRPEVESTRRMWPESETPAPDWRDSFGSARKEAVAKAAAEAKEEGESLGFYERRLAGLRDRIRDAAGDPKP